ncbi:MAG: hypothetical protein WKG01_13370 [Kofleriaceae bacterium]
MRAVVVMFALVACGGSSKPVAKPNTAPLKLPRSVSRVGEVLLIHKSEELDAKQGETKLAQRKQLRLRTKVLGVADGEPTKISVTYDEHAYSLVIDGVERSARPALTGKTFVLEHADGATVVTKEVGELTDAERDAVLEDHKSFGKPSPFLEAIAKREWKVGAAVELDAKAFIEVDNEGGTGKMLFTLVSYDDQIAKFELQSSVKKDELTIDSKGGMDTDLRDPAYGVAQMTSKITGPTMGTQRLKIVTSRAR